MYCSTSHRVLHSFPTRRSFRSLSFFLINVSAQTRQSTADDYNATFKPLKWRSIGPFRGGRTNCATGVVGDRSEEHTSELQSRPHLVCRLLLENKKSRSEPQQLI